MQMLIDTVIAVIMVGLPLYGAVALYLRRKKIEENIKATSKLRN